MRHRLQLETAMASKHIEHRLAGRWIVTRLHQLIMRCGRRGGDTYGTGNLRVAEFACALYTRQVDGSPRRRTLLVIRTRMALQRLIIDAANMWQLLINTHAGRVAQTRWAVTIGRKARGERWEGWGGRDTGEEGNDRLAVEVRVQLECDIPVAEMMVTNCVNSWGTFTRNQAEGRVPFCPDCRPTIKKQCRNEKWTFEIDQNQRANSLRKISIANHFLDREFSNASFL